MGIFHVKGRIDQDMVAAADSNDLDITLPTTPSPTEVYLKTRDFSQHLWISFTGLAGVNEWSKVLPTDGTYILIPSGATNMYLRKPRNRTPDIFRQTEDDNILRVEVEFTARK